MSGARPPTSSNVPAASAREAVLRDHSRYNGQKLADVASAIVDSHLLLLPATQPGTADRH